MNKSSHFDPYEPPRMPMIDEVPVEIRQAYDPNHFCQSWCECCQQNLDLKKSDITKEDLTTWKPIFTRNQWKDYISEICWNLSYNPAFNPYTIPLTSDEREACKKFMHNSK